MSNSYPTITEKLSKSYMDDILKRKEQYFKEREERIREEQMRLNELEAIAEREKREEFERKKLLNNLQYEDYKRNQEKAKIKLQRQYQEKMAPQQVSLELNSENNMNSYKNYIQRLSDRVDNNAIRFEKYKRTHQNKYDNNLNHSVIINNNRRLKDISEVYGIRREPTDITDKTIFDKHNNKDYVDYREKNKEFCEFNKSLMNYVDREREDSMMRKILMEEKRNIQNRNFYDKMEMEAKLYDNERKRQYREMLDEQRRTQVVKKLENENFTIDSVNINPQYYKEVELENDVNVNNYPNSSRILNKSMSTGKFRMKSPDHSFLNKNKFVEVNPFCKRNYNLGSSQLENNPILHPKIDYKFNRYLFPETMSLRSVSPFTMAGYSIAN